MADRDGQSRSTGIKAAVPVMKHQPPSQRQGQSPGGRAGAEVQGAKLLWMAPDTTETKHTGVGLTPSWTPETEFSFQKKYIHTWPLQNETMTFPLDCF